MTTFRDFGEAAGSRGLHLGDGLFETVLVRAGGAVRLDVHLARMARSASMLGVPVPADLARTVSANLRDMWDAEGRPARAALRITVSRGAWAGIAPDPGARADAVLALRALPAEPPSSPLRAVVLDAPRIDPSHPLSGHKTLSAMSLVEARRRAVEAGFDVALLCTLEGDVAEADTANVFAVVGGVVVTPPLSRGILPGLTRARVIDCLRSVGLSVLESPLRGSDLTAAAEVFLTSSLDGVRSVGVVGIRPLPPDRPVAAMAATAAG